MAASVPSRKTCDSAGPTSLCDLAPKAHFPTGSKQSPEAWPTASRARTVEGGYIFKLGFQGRILLSSPHGNCDCTQRMGSPCDYLAQGLPFSTPTFQFRHEVEAVRLLRQPPGGGSNTTLAQSSVLPLSAHWPFFPKNDAVFPEFSYMHIPW